MVYILMRSRKQRSHSLWAKLSETVAFAQKIGAGRMFPIHDALLVPLGRGVYLNNLGKLVTDTEMLDLAGAGATDF